MDVEILPQVQQPIEKVPSSLLRHLVKVWEALDAYFVYQIEVFLGRPITDEESKKKKCYFHRTFMSLAEG